MRRLIVATLVAATSLTATPAHAGVISPAVVAVASSQPTVNSPSYGGVIVNGGTRAERRVESAAWFYGGRLYFSARVVGQPSAYVSVQFWDDGPGSERGRHMGGAGATIHGSTWTQLGSFPATYRLGQTFTTAALGLQDSAIL